MGRHITVREILSDELEDLLGLYGGRKRVSLLIEIEGIMRIGQWLHQ